MKREMPGQLGLFAEPEPGSCPHEIGRYSTKTECTSAGRPIWTNCREVGHCVIGFGVEIPDDEEDEWQVQRRTWTLSEACDGSLDAGMQDGGGAGPATRAAGCDV